MTNDRKEQLKVSFKCLHVVVVVVMLFDWFGSEHTTEWLINNDDDCSVVAMILFFFLDRRVVKIRDQAGSEHFLARNQDGGL